MKRWLFILVCLINSLESAVVKITHADTDATSFILLHDQHRGSRNFTDMIALDSKQRQPLWNFFHALEKKKTPTLVLLEISHSERASLLQLSPRLYDQKSFRKQLAYRFLKGKKFHHVTVRSWDQRTEIHRQVSWMLANTIDTLIQLYQDNVGCKAESSCITWFDTYAANDFFNKASDSSSFHQQVRTAIEHALLGLPLSSREKEMGFWAVKPILVGDYLDSLKPYHDMLELLQHSSNIPQPLVLQLQQQFDGALHKIERLIEQYPLPAGKPRSMRHITINEIILYHLLQSPSLAAFDQTTYAPLCALSILLGDITLLKNIIEAETDYDTIIVYAGDNHREPVIKYLESRGYIIKQTAVVGMNDEELERELQRTFATPS